MTLLSDMLADLDVLIDPDGFASSHEFMGETVLAVIDEDMQQPRAPSQANFVTTGQPWEGLATGQILLACKAADLSAEPLVGQSVTLDGLEHTVRKVSNSYGLLVVTLQRLDDSQQLATVDVLHFSQGDGWSTPAVVSTESSIPCRRVRYAEPASTPDGRVSQDKARFSFGKHCGLQTLVIGDEIVDGELRWRVVQVQDELGQDGLLVQRIGWVTAL